MELERQSLPKSLPLYCVADLPATCLPLSSEITAPPPADRLVLDTNVALDWLLFKDKRFDPIARQLTLGTAVALASPGMRDELQRMLQHASLAKYLPNSESMLGLWDQTVQMRPTAASATTLLCCRDADDQVFIDLALHERASWLVTRDKDLLALARRARKLGLAIITPEQWATLTPLPSGHECISPV